MTYDAFDDYDTRCFVFAENENVTAGNAA